MTKPKGDDLRDLEWDNLTKRRRSRYAVLPNKLM
jgi:hypothetical protein